MALNKSEWFASYPEHIHHDVEIPDISLPQMLQRTTETYGDREAVSFFGRKMSYKELLGLVQGFASALQSDGFQKGDRVAIMLPNCPQYVISYYGTLTAGGIVTQVNPMLVERELEYILNDSGAETIVVYDALYPRVKAIKENTGLKTIIAVSLKPGIDTEGAMPFDAFLSTQTGQIRPAEIVPEHDVAVLQYTGGTTGRSKGAMLTHRNLVANVVQSLEFFKNDVRLGQERCLTVIPLFHVFGMTSCMNLTILGGNSMILLPRFEIEEVLNVIKQESPTIFPGVPTMYVAITNHPGAEAYGIDSIRICNSGSAPMPVELLREFERKTGAKILEGYGLSEAAPTTHCNPSFADRKPGTVGLGFPATAYKIVDVGTGENELPPGQLGEVIVAGPQIMKGYWNMPEETAAAVREGWLYTGDIGSMDEEGYLSIVDRKKDMIIAGGYNIYPRDIEEVLYEHPAVQEAVVVGVPDAYRGETVKAFIVLKDGAAASEDDITAFCRKQMSAYKVPSYIEFRQELPKTSVGKILRRALREEGSGNPAS
ncbi:long-chain-fatty-acid--CoA ligase [Bacillus lacus]|uniref:Long-chain-fatty-acid--CoA ligase n=1 Tax=Metabacillus lacus TaxID=1983721 RepID=A0A7X2IYP9_9BACI|nr:long-chain fatty acid--CoA ligase [Metabacillus lacus]MRX72240.1 long-chain-fatty-acid--CoA ligase [Metabacillus lacus]